jgi:hypothetical protein
VKRGRAFIKHVSMTDNTNIVPTAGVGQPSKILEYGNRVIDFIEQGYPIKRSTELAGIAFQTHRDWYTRGERAQRLMNDGGNPASSEYIYIDYYNRFNQAQNSRRKMLADVVFLSAVGGDKIREKRTVQVVVDGQVVREETHETEKELGKDWRAAAFYLKMMHRDDWHTRVDQNITPNLSAQDALAEALNGMDDQSKQIALRNLAIVAGLPEGDEDIVEGELDPSDPYEDDDLESEEVEAWQ